MPPNELNALAARYVPGSGPLTVHPLRNGLVNETYRVLRDGGTFALRMMSAHPYDLGQDRDWEARVLERAVPADLAPVLEYCDPRRGILITRWIDGPCWTSAQARQPKNGARIAALLQSIHALPIPMPARVMNPALWIDYYSAAAGALSSRALGLRPAATERLAALAALPATDSVLCHSDVHRLNLIDRGDSLVLLDWEYAHAADPLWDLAGWSANNDLEDEMRHELLQAYLVRPPGPMEYLRLQLLVWLYDYVCLLWSELYLNLHSGVETGPAAEDGVSARAHQLEARLASSPSSRAD
jgi:thiamine kinase-like enzyme